MLHIVLVEPQIPPNTGNVARLCAAFGITLHLVHPLGFSTDDRYLKRAGLDYWPHVTLVHHESFKHFTQENSVKRFFFFTTKSSQSYLEASFKDGDFLIFGSETKGLGANILETYTGQAYTIPMSGKVRSLNLSSSVALIAGEALRQINL